MLVSMVPDNMVIQYDLNIDKFSHQQ